MIQLRRILLYDNLYRVLLFLTIIYALYITIFIKYESNYKGNETLFNCKLNSYKIDGNKLDMNLYCKEKIKATYYIKSLEEKEYLSNNLKLDSTLSIKGSLEKPSNNTVPYMFNYKKYLYNNKIYYLLNIESFNIEKTTNNIFYKIKNLAFNHANKFKSKEYIYAFVLGSTSYIDNDVLSTYRENGISHLFALSGLHVSIFSAFLIFILKKLKVPELTRYILVFIFLLLFSFITNFSPSILRATLLFFFLGINKVFYLNIRTINILYLVYILLTLINPFIIYNVSFILSFTAAFYLILSNDLTKSNNYFIGLLKISLISTLGTLPISIYYFGSINLIGFILNLIFVPYVSFIVFPFTLITFIVPKLYFILNILTSILESISMFTNKLKLIVYFPKVSIYFIIFYNIIFILFIKTKKKKHIIFLIIITIFIKIKPYLNSDILVYYIDVGQGDSILLSSSNRKENILIDTGGKISYEKEKWEERKTKNIADNIITFLRKLGINKLDYLIITHGDNDHSGDAEYLVENFKVNKVILNCGSYNNLEKRLIKVLNKNNIKYSSCIKNLNIDKYKLKFLNTKEYDNENDNSNVIYTNLNNYKFLFMGDAGINKEEDIINKYDIKNIDFLKVGHHGSNTSSSKDFIDKIKPRYSIISVGKNNRYGHPKEEVLSTLKSSKIYRTDKDGTIEVRIKGSGYKIKTYSP